MLVEHARNLVGIPNASHAEYGTDGVQVITALACSLQDQAIAINIRPDSRLETLYQGRRTALERTTCSYGLAPEIQHIAGEKGMRIAATDGTGEVRAIERTGHPFFIGTLYQPQLRSSEAAPHPVFVGMISSAIASSRGIHSA